MSDEPKTYQPNWGEPHKHHHHHHSRSKHRNRGLGGALRMIDKQAYVGLILIIVLVLGLGVYKLLLLIAAELRAMPNDDPTTEMNVDELRINTADEQNALLISDSLAQEMNVDTITKQVQIATRPVYRPPRPNDEWYLTERDWKNIWQNYRLWRKMRQENEQ